jgi:hypothetical protein
MKVATAFANAAATRKCHMSNLFFFSVAVLAACLSAWLAFGLAPTGL